MCPHLFNQNYCHINIPIGTYTCSIAMPISGYLCSIHSDLRPTKNCFEPWAHQMSLVFAIWTSHQLTSFSLPPLLPCPKCPSSSLPGKAYASSSKVSRRLWDERSCHEVETSGCPCRKLEGSGFIVAGKSPIHEGFNAKIWEHIAKSYIYIYLNIYIYIFGFFFQPHLITGG